MSIQILGGVGKGLKLMIPPGPIMRPTSVMLRRRIFDCYQDLSSYSFIDCCAGSGGMGLEAWSRGASQAAFFEKNPNVSPYLKKNLNYFREKFPLLTKERPLYFYQGPFDKMFSLRPPMKYFDKDPTRPIIFFLDPPYEKKDVYLSILNKIKSISFNNEIELWVESNSQKGFSTHEIEDWGIPCVNSFSQGKNFILVMKFKDESK